MIEDLVIFIAGWVIGQLISITARVLYEAWRDRE